MNFFSKNECYVALKLGCDIPSGTTQRWVCQKIYLKNHSNNWQFDEVLTHYILNMN